ncbi:unnamed protein product [Rotaria magnacalcarata]|uniref:Uncharacterized protein n=2 Tax=Rotaria magnacalcarata TaxID=392030 RepID=A0A814IQT1_9BILA|nr:unnamed protein product [Rotaria magnacalcarata]CAF1294085.1 unnamed protein product [Rotaria magnacalcarata]
MCYYCRYLENEKTKKFIERNHVQYDQYIAQGIKYRHSRSCDLTTALRLIGMTIFFVMLNVTIVLSQSSQVQQQKDQSSSKILVTNSRDFLSNYGHDQDRQTTRNRQNSLSRPSQSSSSINSTSSSHPPKTKRLTHEKRLIRDLLNNYPTIYARPIRNISEPLMIQFGLTLTQLFDLGSTGQKMQTNTWKTFIWQDMNLAWNVSDYGGLQTVCLPADSIWTPDIVLYNYADERLKDWRDISAVIQHTGDILYVPTTMQFSVCFLDITKFPYDIHQCSLVYRSWTYDHTKLILTFKENISAMDMTSYINSNEWKVVALPAENSITEDGFSLLTYTMIIQRKGGLYGYILILPCLLLSAATMVVFWIPPESPAKMILTVSIFSGLFLLLLLLAESVPGGGGTPNIGYYYCVNMVVVSVTAVLATTVIHIYVRGDCRQGISLTIRRIFLQELARLYCMAPRKLASPSDIASSRYGPPSPGAILLPEHIFLTHHFHEEEFSKKLKLLKQRFKEFHRQQQQHGGIEINSIINETMTALSLNLRSIENDLKEVRDYLRHMKKKVENSEKSNKDANDWKQVALVLDRTFFFAYFLWFMISVFVIFPKTINISKRNWSIPMLASLNNISLASYNLTFY